MSSVNGFEGPHQPGKSWAEHGLDWARNNLQNGLVSQVAGGLLFQF